MIVGGGVSGMQTAQTAAMRGHQVTLCEKSDRLGGMLGITAALPFKEDFRRYLAWMVDKTERCGAEVRSITEVTPERIEIERPDAVLVAVGAEPIHPPIPGIDGDNVVWVGDVDTGRVSVGDRVVIAGVAPVT